MATINSHRKRQVYSEVRRERQMYLYRQAPPKYTFVMMPSKMLVGEEYYAINRKFANPSTMVNGSNYLNSMKEVFTGANNQTKYYTRPTPAGVIDKDSYESHRSGLIYQGGQYFIDSIRRSRQSSGIYGVYITSRRAPKQQIYSKVVELGSYVGGNIKSRQALLKWVGGMWRSKK